ncbi:MAG: tetratricopeptide (TPR) repeat protein [Myxococcota bacterium]|jgi:tetratricopeptide (TPR) repeat protein
MPDRRPDNHAAVSAVIDESGTPPPLPARSLDLRAKLKAHRAASKQPAADLPGLDAIPPPVPAADLEHDGTVTGKEASKKKAKARKTGKRPRPIKPPPDPFMRIAETLVKRFQEELMKGDPRPGRAARLQYEAGRLLEYPLGRLDEAVSHYVGSLKTLPEHLPSIRGARRCLLRLGRYHDVLPHLAAELQLTPDAETRVSLLRMRAEVLEKTNASPDRVRQTFVQALAVDPADAATLKALERHDLDQKNWARLSQTYAQNLQTVHQDNALRATLLTARARLAERRLNDPEAAILLYEQALELDPNAPGALRAAKRLLSSAQRWTELVTVLELESKQSNDPRVRVVGLHRIAGLQLNQLGDRGAAIRTLEGAAEAAPQDPLLLDALAELYEAERRFDDLRQTLERRANTLTDSQAKIALWYRLGELCEVQLDDANAAAQWFQSALFLDGSHTPSLRAMERYCESRELWRQLVDIHLQEANSAVLPERRATAYARAGALAEVRLQDPPYAIAQYERALTLVPGHSAAYEALLRLYFSTGDFRALVELHERAAGRALTDNAAIHHLFTIGVLYENQLNEPGHAVAVYRRILERDATRLPALHALQRAAERAGRYHDLVEAIDRELDTEPSAQRAAALHLLAGETLADRLSDLDRAIVSFRRVIDLDEASWPALGHLARIYRELGRWDSLLWVYETELGLEPAGPQAVRRLMQMGELCEHELGRIDQAIGYYERAIAQDPTHRPALDALVRGFRSTGQTERLVEVLRLVLKTIQDPVERANTAFETALITEHELSDPETAIKAYRLALTARPDWGPALDALQRLHDGHKSWHALLEVLADEREGTEDLVIQRDSLMQEGQLRRDALDQTDEAIKCFERVRKYHPSDVGALHELESLYYAKKDHAHLADVYDTLAQVIDDDHAKVAVLHELARLQQDHDLGDATNTFKRLIRLARADVTALERLEASALVDDDRVLLRQVDARILSLGRGARSVLADHATRLAESLEATNNDAALEAYMDAVEASPDGLSPAYGLVRVSAATRDDEALEVGLLHLATLCPDPNEGADCYRRLANIRAKRLDDIPGALEALDRALELLPNDVDAAQHVVTLATRRDEIELAAGILARTARASTHKARREALWNQVAVYHARDLDDRAGAIIALRQVLEANPTHIPSLLKLSDLYLLDAQYEDSAACLEQSIPLMSDPSTVWRTRVKLAGIFAKGLNDLERARRTLATVRAQEIDEAESLHALFSVQQQIGDAHGSIDTARRLVQGSPDNIERGELSVQLGELLQSVGDAAAASAFADAIVWRGVDGDGASSFRALIPDQADWATYRTALRSHLRQLPRDVPALEVYTELSRVERDHLDLGEEALRTLREGLVRSPDAMELRVRMVDALLESRHSREAVSAARTLVTADVRRPDSWRALAAAFRRQEQFEAAKHALAPLVALEMASEEEVRLVRAQLVQPDPQGVTIDDAMQRRIGVEAPGHRATETALAAFAEYTSKVFPEALDEIGLASCTRLRPRAPGAPREAVDWVAAAFGLDELDVYVDLDDSAQVRAVPGSLPGLVVPATIAQREPGERLFMLGQGLSLIARGLMIFDILSDTDIEIFLAAIARLGGDRRVPVGVGADVVEEASKRLNKAIPRRARRKAEDDAAAYITAERIDIAELREALTQTQARVALLLSNDLPAAWSHIVQSTPKLANDLLLFWTSELATRTRVATGITRG